MNIQLRQRFAPVTHSWGFLRAPIDVVATAMENWMQNPGRELQSRWLEGSLATALSATDPICGGVQLLATTQSEWTAVFRDTGSGPASEISYLSFQLKCDGIQVFCVETRYNRQTKRGALGSMQFYYLAGDRADGLDVTRQISAGNQGDHWIWINDGSVLPFEQPDKYKARRIRDRFTREMLGEYCAHFGIRLFDEDFYGPNFFLLRCSDPDTWPPGTPRRTYASWQHELGLDTVGSEPTE